MILFVCLLADPFDEDNLKRLCSSLLAASFKRVVSSHLFGKSHSERVGIALDILGEEFDDACNDEMYAADDTRPNAQRGHPFQSVHVPWIRF